ncbi:MAG: hypothetical protein ACRC5T_00890 [Cetobacterium sp.]
MNNLERIKCFKHGTNEVVFEGIRYDLKASDYKDLASIIHTEIELDDSISIEEVESILLEAILVKKGVVKMKLLQVKRMKNSTSGNPNWMIKNGTDRDVLDVLLKKGIIKEYKNKQLGTYLKTKSDINFSYQIAKNAVLSISGIEFKVEIV